MGGGSGAKAFGFADLELLSFFMKVLEAAVIAHGDAIEPVVQALETAPVPCRLGMDVDSLVMAARAWMSDVHDYCTLTDRRLGELEPEVVRFDREVRQFRRDRPWLLMDLSDNDVFEYVHPTEGAVIFHGLRTSPDGSEQVLLAANMEGAPRQAVPTELTDTDADGWELGVAAPRLDPGPAHLPLTLSDATAAIWVRSR